MTDVPRMLSQAWRAIERAANDREAERAKADPQAHKLSRVIEGRGALNYRYVGNLRDGRGRRVRFCWSLHRNVAGYFLTWREVTTAKLVKRDRWTASRRKKQVRAIAERRHAACAAQQLRRTIQGLIEVAESHKEPTDATP